MVERFGPSVKPCIFTRFSYSKEYLDKALAVPLGTLDEGVDKLADSLALSFVDLVKEF